MNLLDHFWGWLSWKLPSLWYACGWFGGKKGRRWFREIGMMWRVGMPHHLPERYVANSFTTLQNLPIQGAWIANFSGGWSKEKVETKARRQASTLRWVIYRIIAGLYNGLADGIVPENVIPQFRTLGILLEFCWRSKRKNVQTTET